MKSFFSSLRRKFDASYEGRYFSTILNEVLRAEPAAVKAIFPFISRKVESALAESRADISIEYRFAEGQRADLAIVQDGFPVVLVEVKQSDIDAGGVCNQLEAYRKFVRRSQRPIDFILLSEFRPHDEHFAILNKDWGSGSAKSMRLYELALRLRAHESSPAVRLLLDYMLENAMSGYTPLPRSSKRDLKVLLSRLLPTPHANGLGRLQSNSNILGTASTFNILLTNARYMEEWLRRKNDRCFSRTFASEFEVYPYFDKKAVQRHLERQPDEPYGALPNKFCVGGGLAVYVKGRISHHAMGAKPGMSIVLWMGFDLELDLHTSKIHQSIWAAFSGRKAFAEASQPGWVESYQRCAFSSEEGKVRASLQQALVDARKEASNITSSRAVSRFLKKLDLGGL